MNSRRHTENGSKLLLQKVDNYRSIIRDPWPRVWAQILTHVCIQSLAARPQWASPSADRQTGKPAAQQTHRPADSSIDRSQSLTSLSRARTASVRSGGSCASAAKSGH